MIGIFLDFNLVLHYNVGRGDDSMGILYQKDKRTGITYVYENNAYWDKEKQQSRAKRKLIGKIDPKTNEIIPTRSYVKKASASIVEQSSNRTPGPVAIKDYKRQFYGASYLLDQIGKETGVTEDLKSCFPTVYKQIQSIAYFLILEENNSLSRFPHWNQLNAHPYGENIASQRSSELFQMIDEESRMAFFKKQGKRRIESEYWAFDTTSISSYSETLTQVKWGKNKESDELPQINLALLFGEDSGLPFYYRKLPGNMSDSKTIKQLMAEFNVLGYPKVKVVLDRGFFSKDNVNEFYKNHQKFLMGVKLNLKIVSEVFEKVRATIENWSNYHSQFGTYGVCQTVSWSYEQKRPYKGDTLRETRRVYVHIFYHPEKAAREKIAWTEYWNSLYQDLVHDTKKAGREKDYQKFFTVKETPKRGRVITAKDDVMEKSMRACGFFALLSNDVKDSFEALSLYRSKDLVEKGFGNLKDRLNSRRFQVSSELSLNGKIFVEFIALIYLSFIKKRMQEAHLYDNWTLQGLLDELSLVERFEAPGHGRILGEITKKQEDLFKLLKIQVPSL